MNTGHNKSYISAYSWKKYGIPFSLLISLKEYGLLIYKENKYCFLKSKMQEQKTLISIWKFTQALNNPKPLKSTVPSSHGCKFHFL